MNVNIQTPMFQYSVFLSKSAMSCLEYMSDNQGNVIVFADSYDIGPTGSLNFYRISSSEGKNVKIPVYSVPANSWISVVLINEDQRQVIFEEEPSFDYEFDDMDFIRNRNAHNPLFIENELEKSSSIPNSENTQPIINIQNILPDNMLPPQTVAHIIENTSPQSLDNINNNVRISVTDEQMNGLLNSIQQLTQLFVQQQHNFNNALELQGKQLLQMQPLIEKITTPNFAPQQNYKENVLSTSSKLNENSTHNLNDENISIKNTLLGVLKKIPKNVTPLMPNLYSGTKINLNDEISTLNIEKKSVLKNLESSISNHTPQTPNEKIDDNILNKSLNESINTQNPPINEETNTNLDDHNENIKTVDLNTSKASSMEELLASYEAKNHKNDNENTINIVENISNHEHETESQDISVHSTANELSDNDLSVLNDVNNSNSLDDLADADMDNLVSAIDVIQHDEENFKEELKEIVQETNELINNKDALHFKDNEYNPSGALAKEEQHNFLEDLNNQAEEILSQKDEYSHKELDSFSNTSSNTETNNKTQKDKSENNNTSDNDENDNNLDELLELMDTEDQNPDHKVEFEPIPDDDDNILENNTDSDSDSISDTDNAFNNSSHSHNHDESENNNEHDLNQQDEQYKQEETQVDIGDDSDDSDISSDDLDIFALLKEEDNSKTNDKSKNNVENNDDLDLMNDFINSKNNNTNSSTPDDFSLDELDNLEALIEPAKKSKNKPRVTSDDSENQDEFVSSQILSYVFSDLEDDEFFEVDNFLKYFEENNLHKAFGKVSKDKIIYLVCRLLKNKNANPSKFARFAIQKKLRNIMPDVAKEHWTGSISNIMDVFEEEKLLDGVNEIDICVWFVKNNFF